jgi:hypothetical protein
MVSLSNSVGNEERANSANRQSFLEIDKMNGTPFPPDNVPHGSQTHGLRDIFSQAGIMLDVRLDESDIPDLAGPDGVYTDAELDNLMTFHRNPNFQEIQGKMSAYIVVATRYHREGVLGVMFDSQQRLGCAVFYEHSLIHNDQLAFFRTTAHELGHEYNLHHEDGVPYMENGVEKYSLMNQTKKIQESQSGWPLGIGFKFKDREILHMSTHEIIHVKPGGNRFYECNSEHESWHQWII